MTTVAKAKLGHQKAILSLAKLSIYTKGYADVNFIADYYNKGWVIGAYIEKRVAGFALIRHLTKKPYTMLYYLGVAPPARKRGVGRSIVEHIRADSPHEEIKLITEKCNQGAKLFYSGLGFKVTGEGMNRSGIEHWEMSNLGS